MGAKLDVSEATITSRSRSSGARYVRVGQKSSPEDVLFFFFSNRLGCLGSIGISVLLTLVLASFLGLW